MIAIYARVSSKQQDQRAQMNELRAWYIFVGFPD
jgi:DNA invertase Pin-like site-specific DNA recombinase